MSTDSKLIVEVVAKNLSVVLINTFTISNFEQILTRYDSAVKATVDASNRNKPYITQDQLPRNRDCTELVEIEETIELEYEYQCPIRYAQLQHSQMHKHAFLEKNKANGLLNEGKIVNWINENCLDRMKESLPAVLDPDQRSRCMGQILDDGTQWCIAGRLDAVFRNLDDDETRIFELKTRVNKLYGATLEREIMQCITYMKLMKSSHAWLVEEHSMVDDEEDESTHTVHVTMQLTKLRVNEDTYSLFIEPRIRAVCKEVVKLSRSRELLEEYLSLSAVQKISYIQKLMDDSFQSAQ